MFWGQHWQSNLGHDKLWPQGGEKVNGVKVNLGKPKQPHAVVRAAHEGIHLREALTL